MAQNKLELLKQLSDEFEALERHAHSKKLGFQKTAWSL